MTTQLPVTPLQPKKGLPKWALALIIAIGSLILIIGVIIAIAVVTAINLTNAPREVSNQFVNAVQAKNTQEAYGLTSQKFKDATPEARLEMVVQQVAPQIQGEETVRNTKVTSSSNRGGVAVVLYEVQGSNGKVYIKTQLEKDGDAWKVLTFKTSKTELTSEVE